jgi:monoamine oxidase
MTQKHCVVIGAGLAGLAAAYRLRLNGWTVDVLEADRERLGGRVFTRQVDLSGGRKLFYELGGEWIGEGHHRIHELCKIFKLDLINHRYSFAFWGKGLLSGTYEPGSSPFSQTSQEAFSKFSAHMRKYNDCENRKLDRIDWWTKLKQLGFSQRELDHRELMDSTDFGESIRHTSAFAAATEYVFSNPSDEMDEKIIGGNELLPRSFAMAINQDGECIRMGRKVVRVEQTKGRVVVFADTDEQFAGDACICAVPASVLHKIHWNPPLPEEQRAAAEELQYARIMKTAVLFSERFWPDHRNFGFSLFTNRASDFCFDSTFGQEGPEGIICSYAIGDKADDLADETDHDLARWIAEDVSTAVGKNKDSIKARFLHRKEWQRDDCIGGAYAFYRPGQWFSIRPALQRPHGRVAFAGEHLSESWQGFMEGAIETGEAAAESL